jgi:hypothetical protein
MGVWTYLLVVVVAVCVGILMDQELTKEEVHKVVSYLYFHTLSYLSTSIQLNEAKALSIT